MQTSADVISKAPTSFIKSEKSLVIALFLIMFLVYSENFIIAPLLAEMSASLNMSIQLSANLISIYTLAVGFGALLYGPFSDSIGRFKSITFSLMSFAVFTFLCGMAWDVYSVYSFRVACGLSAGILTSNAFAYIGDYYMDKGNPQSIPVTMGKVMSGMFSAIVVGVPLGILVGHLSSWRVAFFALGVLAVLLLTFLIIAVEYVPSKKLNKNGYFNSLSTYFTFLHRLPLLKITALFFTFQLVVTAFGTFSPLWILGNGFDLLTLSILYAVTGFTSVFVAMRSGAWVKKLGISKTMLIANIFIIASLTLMIMLPFNIWLVAILIAVYLSCVSLRIGPLQALAVMSIDSSERGRYSALNSFAMQMGSAIGVFIFSMVMSNLQTGKSIFNLEGFCFGVVGLAGITFISLIIALTIKPSAPKSA